VVSGLVAWCMNVWAVTTAIQVQLLSKTVRGGGETCPPPPCLRGSYYPGLFQPASVDIVGFK